MIEPPLANSGAGRGPWADPEFATRYDAVFVPRIALHVAQRLLELAAPRPGERVLECACGTGALSLPLAQLLGRGGQLLCSDLAPAALAIARAKPLPFDSARPAFALLNLLSLGVTGSQFDLALCNLGLQIVPERQQALRELWRALRPGGRLAFSVPGLWSLEPFWTYFWERVAKPDVAGALREAPRRWTPADIATAVMRDRQAWQATLASSGFGRVQLSVEPRVMWFASAEEFLASGAFGQIGFARNLFVDAGARERVFRDVLLQLQKSTSSHGLPIDVTVLYGIAYKPDFDE